MSGKTELNAPGSLTDLVLAATQQEATSPKPVVVDGPYAAGLAYLQQQNKGKSAENTPQPPSV